MAPIHDAEHIIFAIDMDKEVGKLTEIRGVPVTRLDLIKDCIVMIVNAKRQMHPGHRFSIVLLREQAELLADGLNTDMRAVYETIDALNVNQTYAYTTFEMGTLLNLLEHHRSKGLRVVLIYSRSNTVPSWTNQHHSQVAVDVLYLHNAPEDGKNCPQQVYDALTEIADNLSNRANHHSYINELSEGQFRKIYTIMATFISHPNVRVLQQSLVPPVELSSHQHPQQPATPQSPAQGATRAPQDPYVRPSSNPASSLIAPMRTIRGIVTNQLMRGKKGNNSNSHVKSQELPTKLEQDPSIQVKVDTVVPDTAQQHYASTADQQQGWTNPRQ